MRLLGALILLAVFAVLFWMTAQPEGWRAAVVVWLFGIVGALLITLGMHLLVGGRF